MTKPIKIKPWYIVVIVLLIIAVWGGVKAFYPMQNYDTFAQCLSDKGAVMYGAYWCSHCKAQKADFGDSFQYVNYVECTEDTEKCTADGIKGYPSWIINGELYEGVQPFGLLSSLTDCPVS